MEDFGNSLKEGLGSLGSMSIKGFDRAKQFSQEKMGSAVKTEYDQVRVVRDNLSRPLFLGNEVTPPLPTCPTKEGLFRNQTLSSAH